MESGGNAELCAYQDNHSGQTRISIHDIGKLMILYATIMSGGTGGDIRTV